ncbi:MAG: 2-hydroxychromene-2-carboxylate isomerase [Pseudomonas sp.]|nr:2-hydroxychromene-2-carboxylate isomerase [Pseudomonas sp.]
MSRVQGDGTSTIAFYFDFLSPFAYLARHRLVAIAQQHGCNIDYRPIDLARAKYAIGNTGPTNRELPVKLAYLMKDLQRWAERYGVPFEPVQNHNSRLLNLGTFYAREQEQADDYVELAYRYTWGEGGAPDDPQLHRRIARELRWDEEAFVTYLGSDEAEACYERSNREAIKRGVFGVPTLCFGDEMWWGNDRLDFLEEHLRRQRQD